MNLLLQFGSLIFFVFTILGILINKKSEEYSILYSELSNTGIRSKFTHPKTGIRYSKSNIPELFTIGLIGSGSLWLIGFIQILEMDLFLSFIGITFSIFIICVGYFDISQYHIHNFVVTMAQIAFLGIVGYVSVEYGKVTIYCLSGLIILFLIQYMAVRSKNQKSSGSNRTIISQKIYIYLEIIFLFLLPDWIS